MRHVTIRQNVDYMRYNFESKILSEFKLNNGGQFYKNIFYFGYFKKLWILQLNKVRNGKCWAFVLKSKKIKIMSDFKLEIDDRFNLFFCERITKTS